MRSHIPLPAALLVAIAVVNLCSSVPPCAVAAREAPLIVGGWSPIKEVNDAHIQELGSWAVEEHVRQAHDGLRFGEVVSGEAQVVAGMNYRLVIAATDGAGVKGTYNAVLYEDLSDNRQLKSFTPAAN